MKRWLGFSLNVSYNSVSLSTCRDSRVCVDIEILKDGSFGVKDEMSLLPFDRMNAY